MSNSLRPHEPQHARPPCPSPTPKFTQSQSIESVMPSSHLILCRPLLLLPPIPPSIRVFPMSHLFASGGQSIGVSASASVLPMNTQDWSPLEWTGLISLQSKGLSRVFSNATAQKYQFFNVQLSSQSNSHIHTCVRLMVNTLYIKVKNQVTVPSASQKNCPNGTIEMSFLTSKCHTLSESRKTHGDHH